MERYNLIANWRNIKINELNKIDDHTRLVLSVCFSHDCTTIAYCSNDKSICLFDVKTGQQKFKSDGHTSTVYSVCFSPDSTTLASGRDDKSIRLWDIKTEKKFNRSIETPILNSNPLSEVVFQGEFVNYQSADLRSLLKSKGSFTLENQVELNKTDN